MRQPKTERLAAYLEHIVKASERVGDYTRRMSEDDFLQSTITQDAVIRNLEVIGEACRNVLRHHPRFADAHPEIEWRAPYEMRNALAHGYFDVDLVVTWAAVADDLPHLQIA